MLASKTFAPAAKVVAGYKVSDKVHAMVVPGSGQSNGKRNLKVWTAFSKKPASIGAKPVAVCAWP